MAQYVYMHTQVSPLWLIGINCGFAFNIHAFTSELFPLLTNILGNYDVPTVQMFISRILSMHSVTTFLILVCQFEKSLWQYLSTHKQCTNLSKAGSR